MSALDPAEVSVDASPGGAFSRTTIIAMLLAGVFSFCTLAVLASFAPDLRQGGDPRAHALSKSAVGFGGLVKLLELEGVQVVVSRTRTAPGNTLALRVLTPEEDTKAAEIRSLAAPLTLVVLPKWRIGPDLRNPDWVMRGPPIPVAEIEKGPAAILKQTHLTRRAGPARLALRSAAGEPLGQVEIAALQTLSGPGVEPMITDESGAIVLGKVIRGEGDPPGLIYVLADPDLLNTYALRDLNGARMATTVINMVRAGPVFFDVTLNGYERGRNLWKLAFTPPFLAATLCALAAGLLMGLHAAVRFGPARREERAIGMGKRALADNQAGLIRMAKREHRMAQPYARLIRERAARAVGAGQVADEAQLETLLDRLGQRRTEYSIAALSAEARQVADPSGLLRLARRLYQWKLEISRERH